MYTLQLMSFTQWIIHNQNHIHCADMALEYAEEYDIQFNPVKWQFVYLGNDVDAFLTFDGTTLQPI